MTREILTSTSSLKTLVDHLHSRSIPLSSLHPHLSPSSLAGILLLLNLREVARPDPETLIRRLLHFQHKMDLVMTRAPTDSRRMAF